MDVLKETENKMLGVLNHLKEELKTLRTGRANPAMIDKVHVDIYGTQMRLVDLATISVPEARQLLITPFDQSTLHSIAKALEAANLNMRIIVDANVVRVKVPEMDQAVRHEMVKLGKQKCETAKVGIRNVRREGNEALKKQKGDGTLAEDGLKRGEKKIQELTDKCCKQADDLMQEKEKEILTI